MNDDRALALAVSDRVSILARSLPRSSSVMVHAYGRNRDRSCQVKSVGVGTRRCLDWRYVRKRKKLQRVPVSRPPLMWFRGVSDPRRPPKTAPQRPLLGRKPATNSGGCATPTVGGTTTLHPRIGGHLEARYSAETLLGFTSGFRSSFAPGADRCRERASPPPEGSCRRPGYAISLRAASTSRVPGIGAGCGSHTARGSARDRAARRRPAQHVERRHIDLAAGRERGFWL